jgi:hypothetical protein
MGLFSATAVLAILTVVTNRLYFRPDDAASIAWFPTATVDATPRDPVDVMADVIYADLVRSGALVRSY